MNTKERRDYRRSNYLCIGCGKKLGKYSIKNKNTRCSGCLKKMKVYITNRNATLLEKGICVFCGKEPIDFSINKRNCTKCFKKKQKWGRRRPEESMITRAKQRAKDKGMEFSIDKSDIIIPKYCPLLGIKLERGSRENFESSPSLDRIDSSKGYIKGNVWVISFKANRIKQSSTLDDLLLLTKNLQEFLIKH